MSHLLAIGLGIPSMAEMTSTGNKAAKSATMTKPGGRRGHRGSRAPC
jgi:hypothetical protein